MFHSPFFLNNQIKKVRNEIIYIYCLGTMGMASLLELETQLLLDAQPRAIVGGESNNKLAILRRSSQ